MKELVSPATAAALLMTLVASLFIACGGDGTEDREIIRPVRCQAVYAFGGKRIRSFSGVAQAGVESRLSFKVGGTVDRLPVKVGDNVVNGMLIAELDKSDFELQVQEAQAALRNAEAQARNAAANYERNRQLYENRNASLNDLDAARAANESAQAAVTSAEKRLELTRSQLSYATLTAPIAGAISEVRVEVNENVQEGNVIAVLTSVSQLEVEVSVPEILISGIREGDPVKVTFDALAPDTITAHITEVAVAAMGMATTYPVVATLDMADDRLRPGMAAEVTFTFDFGDDRERFVVPPASVAEDRQGRFVYIAILSDGGLATIQRRAVSVGEITSDGMVVYEGLLEGDLLVTAGVSRITPGQTVRLLGTEGSEK